MADEQNELEVLEARREILQLEITLARERRAALEAEQKKKTADDGGEPTLDYVVPSKYPDARHAESLPTAWILRRGKPTLLPLPTNPVLQHLEAESVIARASAAAAPAGPAPITIALGFLLPPPFCVSAAWSARRRAIGRRRYEQFLVRIGGVVVPFV